MIEVTIELTVLQRIEVIKDRLEKLERGIPAPPEVVEALNVIENKLTELERVQTKSCPP